MPDSLLPKIGDRFEDDRGRYHPIEETTNNAFRIGMFWIMFDNVTLAPYSHEGHYFWLLKSR